MSILVWIIVGAIAGWIASIITGRNRGQGLFGDIIIGMIGSVIGGALLILFQTGTLDFTLAFTSFNLTSILVSTIGAIVLLFLLKLLKI
jgi:uncharacterized membrane protein YeaQ/YmgE (transglycosylase-associated protein family)